MENDFLISFEILQIPCFFLIHVFENDFLIFENHFLILNNIIFAELPFININK